MHTTLNDKKTRLALDQDKPWLLNPEDPLQAPGCPPSSEPAFNTDAIVFDNSPWRPGRDMDMDEEDERKLKSLATRIMSNGVEVLVKDKNADNGKPDQRRIKRMPMKQTRSFNPTKKKLLASAVSTLINPSGNPLQQQIHKNFIIKTCLTTFTYMTTVVQNKRSAISTFETIVSVVTTEMMTNPYDLVADIKPTRTKFMEYKTIQPSAISNEFKSNLPKLEKRVDTSEEEDNYELIQPSEPGHGHTPCTTSCSCSHTKTESLKTKYNHEYDHKVPLKTTKYAVNKLEVRPTNKQSLDKTQYNGPYEYETNTPTDKIVEKYTEVINEYSDEKDSGSVEESELLTNEQAPAPPKNKVSTQKPEKTKPDKPHKPNKNKFVVADLLKLGSLGIKGLSQLAPVFEKMTGGFIKRQEPNRTTTTTTTTTTVKPVKELTAYNVNKRIDSEIESKHSSFPIYIPVDELETSESQTVFTNATLHQNLAWVNDYNKHPKARIIPPKMVHESPLVNGGIPISPGEIITANSDVIVGKPAVGGPLTLAASGIKLQNPVNPPPIDSFISSNDQYVVKEKPPVKEHVTHSDDSYDLRPPEIPKLKNKHPQRNVQRPPIPPPNGHIPLHHNYQNKNPPRPPIRHVNNMEEQLMKTEQIPTSTILGNHGRPAFLDYIPSLDKSTTPKARTQPSDSDDLDVPDNSPSSSEIINTRVNSKGEYIPPGPMDTINKPFLVDIQPSRVANVLIPHGSTTALVFAGSSEPHKTGDYVDDPLPYPEPGYFGSFSIDAPQLTNVHTTPTKPFQKPNVPQPEQYKPNSYKEQDYRNDGKQKWKGNKRPDYNRPLPPPTSNQETHLQVGPHITVYNPEVYKLNGNGDFEKYNQVRGKDKHKEKEIDKEYENYLAVPPPPMPKTHYHHENHYDKNKFANQKPIVHTKPIQDMKVFLNIQHPVPKPPMTLNQGEQIPQKVTSEIYYAAQAPPNMNTPTYTIHMPPTPTPNQNVFTGQTQNKVPTHFSASPQRPEQNSFYVVPSANLNKPVFINEVNDKDNTYTVTLNTATNVAGNVVDPGQIIGSSVPVSIGNNPNADIPIGTNYAMKVEDGNSQYVHNERIPQNTYEDYRQTKYEFAKENNRWNVSSVTHKPTLAVTSANTEAHSHSFVTTEQIKTTSQINYESSFPSANSHANFPMINEQSELDVANEEIRPVTEYVDEKPDRRPAKLIPNIPTNSHGWYSSVPINDLKNIKIEGTTRKVIPLLQDYNRDSLPDFGQKIQSVGKPPSEYWGDNDAPAISNVGKPFSKPQQISDSHTSPNKQYHSNYIPHNIGFIKQPVYDIPIRDNSDETTTHKFEPSKDKNKFVYEDSEEIYDGEEADNDTDGEVSLESMKVPVVSAGTNEKRQSTSSTTPVTLAKDEVFDRQKEKENNKKTQPKKEQQQGTQTEKPFNAESYNKTHHFQSNAIKQVYEQTNNPQIRPRPFNSNPVTLDHQLHQPHWQINQMEVNSTNPSYEGTFDLNIGEEIPHASTSTSSTSKPTSTHKVPNRYQDVDSKYKRIQRPVFSLRNNSTKNDTNIITSTVQIRDTKPLTVVEDTSESSSTLPTFTITSSNYDTNRTTEIIDLSPPPPTLDYNFKPAAKEETIMGMSPPPRTPPTRPARPPPTPRPALPPRTPPPYRNKPTRPPPSRLPPRTTRKPIIRDEISTYRPAYDILNNAKRPSFNRDQPSSQLLPPPRELPSRVIAPIEDEKTISPAFPNVVFPTPVSTGWMTSNGIGFSTSFDFGPSIVQFPEPTSPSDIAQLPEIPTTDKSHFEKGTTSTSTTESHEDVSSENSVSENVESSSKESNSKESSTENTSKLTSSEEDYKEVSSESSIEDTTTDRMKVLPIRNNNRTRKPYPVRDNDKKPSTNKYKLPPPRPSPSSVIRPTRTLNRPEILYPTRQPNTRKVVRPLPSRHHTIIRPSFIESSETFVDNEYIKPTEVMNENDEPTVMPDKPSVVEKTPILESTLLHVENEVVSKVQPTHHAGNEIKIVDEVIPTKTEFKTEVVTLTKTLTEEPKTVSSISYLNLTHTLTVTKTKTSLISQFEGATTQTLILTNYQTSTIVDVVTEIHTQVQPTTLIETVTKHIPIPVEPTPVIEIKNTKLPLDDISLSSEEEENLIIKDGETTENIQKIDQDAENDKDTFFVVMNKSQNGGNAPSVTTDVETDYDGITRNEQVNNNGVSQVLFGEILLAGTPYLETTNVVNPTGTGYGKECQPDCKASRNERCQRIDGMMKCVCRPGFARMFPDRPCKPTYTYSVKLALSNQGKDRLRFHENLADNSSKQYHSLAMATHEGINRMIMQSDLRDVYHGVHITGFHPVEMKKDREVYQGVMNDFYVQLSDNAHESRLKEVIEKYLRNNNYSLGGTDVYAAGELMERLDVSDFDECTSGQFNDCSEHAQCFNLRGTYTCSCLEGFADLSVNSLYPGRICSAEQVGCEMCNYHGACYSRDDRRVLCECFQWHAGSTCQINLKVVLISLVTVGALLTVVLVICAVVACSKRPRPPQRSIVACIQGMPGIPQGAIPSKQRADRRALINERNNDSGDASSLQNASLPYIPTKKQSSSGVKKLVISDPPAHDPPPVPAPAVMIPRARLHPTHRDSREMASRKQSMEACSEAKLISYLESGANVGNDEMMRRKHSVESSYSAQKDRHNKQGALVSAGFMVSTTIRRDEQCMKDDDMSSIDKHDLQAEMERYDELRKSYSQEDLSEWTDAERRIGELTLSEARSVGGTLPASTGRAASSTRLTHQEANTMAERDLGSTFLLPHVHLYKPDITSDVSEFDSL